MSGHPMRRGAGSLVEILVTLVVMAVAIASVFRLLSSSHREMRSSREYVAGSAAAAELFDRARLAPYELLTATGGLVPAGRLPWLEGLSPLAHLDGGERFASVVEGEGHRIVELEVRWSSRGKEVAGAKGSCRFFVVRTPYY